RPAAARPREPSGAEGAATAQRRRTRGQGAPRGRQRTGMPLPDSPAGEHALEASARIVHRSLPEDRLADAGFSGEDERSRTAGQAVEECRDLGELVVATDDDCHVPKDCDAWTARARARRP